MYEALLWQLDLIVGDSAIDCRFVGIGLGAVSQCE
jgi:hypothetical protein